MCNADRSNPFFLKKNGSQTSRILSKYSEEYLLQKEIGAKSGRHFRLLVTALPQRLSL